MRRTSLWTAAASAAAVLFLALSVNVVSALNPPEVSAKSALLMDAATGRILYEKDADTRRLIASTTKIMTGLLVCESCDLERMVTIPAQAAGIEGSSMGLKAGERYRVRDLLHGLMLQSGNDAATALAICCDGSVEAFVARMNRRARELGLENTHFENPSGLDGETHYATARDLAKLAACAMENEAFAQAASAKSYALGSRVLTNHNKLLWRYEGAMGVKTGYTKAAGRVLVSCAQRNGRRLIAVTISAPDDWRDHAALLDYGFAAYEDRPIFAAGQTVDTVPVVNGESAVAVLVAWDALQLPMLPEEEYEIRIFAPPFVYAPVMVGPGGRAEIWCEGEKLAQVPLFYREHVKQTEKPRRWFGG